MQAFRRDAWQNPCVLARVSAEGYPFSPACFPLCASDMSGCCIPYNTNLAAHMAASDNLPVGGFEGH